MGITLSSTAISSGSGDGIPPLILDAPGAKFRGLIIDIEPDQEKEYLTQQQRDAGRVARPVWWDNRQPTPLTEDEAKARKLRPVEYDIITFEVVKAGDGVVVPDDNDGDGGDRTPQPGEIVKLYAHGPRGRGWRDALGERKAAPNVGDLTLWDYKSEDRDSGRKDIKVTFEEPTAEQVAHAVKLHRDRKTEVTSTAAPMTASDVADSFGATDEPF